jgi:branched-chain amino acid transport system substrate-binding protein
MTRASARERVAIVFMTMSVIATLILGGALIAQLGHPERRVTELNAAAPGTGISAGEPIPADSAGAAGTTDTTFGGATAGSAGGSTSASSPSGARTATTSGTRTGAAGTAKSPTQAAGTKSGGTQTAPGKAAGAAPATGAVNDPGPDNPEQGVASDFITVGGIYDETGPVDATVERDTVRSYFNQVNAAGGVKGRKLRLLDCDSAFDPSRAHQCAQRLLSQKILSIVGWTSPSGEEPETKFLTQQGVPVIGGLSVPAEFGSPLAFPTMASLAVHGTAMGRHAKDIGIQKPGIIVLNLPFVAPVKDNLLKALHESGIQETSVEEVDATKADYTDLVIKLQAAGAKSVLGALDPFTYARMYQAMQRQTSYVPTVGFGLDKKSANDAYGSAVEGAESLMPFIEAFDPGVQNDSGVQEYFGAVSRYYPNQVKNLDVYTEAQWVAAKVFVEALKRIPGPITRQSLVASLETIKDFKPGLIRSISYAPGNHDPNRCFVWIKNKGHAWHTYSDYQCF